MGFLEADFATIKKEEFSLSHTMLIELIQIMLSKHLPFKFKVKGYSMTPFIRDGDVVTLTHLNGSRLSLGTAVAFIHPQNQRLVIHRIVGINDGSYLIKGDNVSCADGFISRGNILGFINRIERKGRRVYLGLGPERPLIAFLSYRLGLISRLLFVHRFLRSKLQSLNE